MTLKNLILSKRGSCFFILILAFNTQLCAQSQLISKLKNGKDQKVIVYGTSLSSGGNGEAWMSEVANQLNARYSGHVSYKLAGKGGMWSTWGVQHIESRVIKENPDVVIIEFAINDAFYKYQTSVKLARLNLEYLIKRIKIYDDSCEVILQIMNMPIGEPAHERPNYKKYYDMYRQVAKERSLPLIDHTSNWGKILEQGKDVFLKHVPDGIHPNIKSARSIIAPYILKKLRDGYADL